MKDKFQGWARETRVSTEEGWTVEQICDALIEAKVAWPPELTNEEGWQLWTAVMRRECKVQSIQWDEVTSGEDYEVAHKLEITFRLSDRREFQTTIPKTVLVEQDFGGVCKLLEERLRAWKAQDDAEREAKMHRLDAEWAERAPDVIDYVIGFRAWQLNGARLKPIGMGNDGWEGGQEVRASCASGKLHRSPDHECECGLYAWNDIESMRREASAGGGGKVWGAVKACGRLEIHRDGFRAEFMQPVALAYDERADEVVGLDSGNPQKKYGPDYHRVKKIADQLGGIDVVPFDILPEVAREHGQILADVPELLPDS